MRTTMINDSDWELIHTLDERFAEKDIHQNFTLFLSLTPEERISHALQKRKELLRTGWVRRGIPIEDAETVDDHVESMKKIARDRMLFHNNFDTIIDIIESHDTSEVIISDFTPADPISKAEKRQIEYAATRVIYESQPHMIDRWLDYEDQRTVEGHITKDLDKGQMYIRANAYNVTHPLIDLNEFHEDCKRYKWRTEEGLSLCHAYQLIRP